MISPREIICALMVALVFAPGIYAQAPEKPEAAFATMSPEALRAFEKDVMRRIADFALIPPKMNTSPLPKYDYDKLDYGMTIGIERTPKGRLWACWLRGATAPRLFSCWPAAMMMARPGRNHV